MSEKRNGVGRLNGSLVPVWRAVVLAAIVGAGSFLWNVQGRLTSIETKVDLIFLWAAPQPPPVGR